MMCVSLLQLRRILRDYARLGRTRTARDPQSTSVATRGASGAEATEDAGAPIRRVAEPVDCRASYKCMSADFTSYLP